MVVLIAGASHTGKTALAQSLLEQKGYPLSVDRPAENGTDSKRTDQLIPGG